MLDKYMTKAFIFDLDDTIMKTERMNIELMKQYFKERYNIEMDKSDQDFVFGHDWQAIYTNMIEKYGLDISIFDIQSEFIKLKREYLENHIVPVAEGIEEVLSIPLPKIIVSGSGKSEIHMLLENADLNNRFDATLSIEEYEKGKPAPDGYLMALKHLDLRPHQALVFEDSQSGIKAAKKAGIPCVFIAQFAEKDHSAHADAAFLTFRDFVSYWNAL